MTPCWCPSVDKLSLYNWLFLHVSSGAWAPLQDKLQQVIRSKLIHWTTRPHALRRRNLKMHHIFVHIKPKKYLETQKSLAGAHVMGSCHRSIFGDLTYPGGHMIIMTSRFSKSILFKMIRFEERLRKAPFS